MPVILGALSLGFHLFYVYPIQPSKGDDPPPYDEVCSYEGKEEKSNHWENIDEKGKQIDREFKHKSEHRRQRGAVREKRGNSRGADGNAVSSRKDGFKGNYRQVWIYLRSSFNFHVHPPLSTCILVCCKV